MSLMNQSKFELIQYSSLEKKSNKWTNEQNNKKTPYAASDERLKSFHVFRATDKLEITPSIFPI